MLPRLAHADITHLDNTLVRLLGWGKASAHKTILRLFQRFNQASATRVYTSSYAWLFGKLQLNPITLDVDSSVTKPLGQPIRRCHQGATQSQEQRPRQSPPHPLMAFPADWPLVPNFWLRPGNIASSNNIEG